ncbi:MAG TPA: aldehyde dehydrogenase family protein, partial [Actinomycetota bacterium]|nr:aldehyde dehydrogenase family protein [Actinomycetota bacterium]
MATTTYGNRTAGSTVVPPGAGLFASVNPARPSEELGLFPESDAAAVDEAVRAAAEAQRDWARVPWPERAETIARTGEILASRKEEMA